jgi:hypothetical protein
VLLFIVCGSTQGTTDEANAWSLSKRELFFLETWLGAARNWSSKGHMSSMSSVHRMQIDEGRDGDESNSWRANVSF